MTKRAAIYTRISKDQTGEGAGVARQEQDCREFAQRRGWEVVEVFSDANISAYSGKHRPGYAALCDAIRDGLVDVVVVWSVDRLYRQTKELETYIDLCQPRGVSTETVKAGPLDLSTPSGRMVAKTLGAVAQYELEQKGLRQQRANQQRATQGRHFGTRRCFGYEPDGLTVREPEADAIRWAFAHIEAGGSLREIARTWNEAGLRGPQKEREWSGSTVSRTMRLPRLAGMRTYKGEIVRGEDGEPIPVEWPAIVNADQWWAVQAILTDPSRKFTPNEYSTLLLSGIAVCDACEAVIQSGGTRRAAGGRMVHRYRCSVKGGHVYREAEPVDAYIEDVIVARLGRPDASEVLKPQERTGPDPAQVRAEIADLNERLQLLAEGFADGSIPVTAWKAGTARATARIADLESSLPVSRATPALVSLVSAADVREAWRALPVDSRREVVRSLLSIRVVAPGTKENATVVVDGERKANPETVKVEWL